MLISVQKFLVLSLLIVPTSCTGTDVCFDEITNSSRAVTALILARGGSKGIKLKNIRKIDGVSLLGLSLTALQEANVFETIWVSTDHQAIADEATKYQVNVHWRDPQTALDTTSSIESVQEFLKNHPRVRNLALVQLKSFKLRWRREGSSNRIIPVNFNYTKRPRRQDWDGEFVEAGMFYFTKRVLLDKSLFQDDKCGVVEIKRKDSLEIDKPADLRLARILFKMRR